MLAAQHAFAPIRSRYVLRPTTPTGTAAILAALLVAVFALHFPGYERHPIVKLIEDETTAREFAGGTPVVSFDGRGWAAEAWLMLYWNESDRPVRAARFGEDGLRGFWYTLATDDSPVEQALRTAEYDGEMIMIVSNQIAGHDTLGFRIERIRFSPEDRVWLRGGSSPPSGEID